MSLLRLATSTVLLCAACTAALAQSYPSKPIRMIVPFPPGGATDIIGRLAAQKLAESMGQQFVVDNRGGAGGTIGTEIAAKAVPDGYVLITGTSSTHSIAPGLYPKLPYDPVKDFAPISLLCTATILLATHPSVPARNVKELIALAKARPDQLSFASTGNGGISHLIGEQFKSMTGVQLVHVPYKGDSPALIDLAAGQVSIMFGTAVAFIPYVKSGKLKALAVTNPARSPIMPDVPTVNESGLKGFEAVQWFGLFAPAGTPKEIVTRLHAETVKFLRLPDVREKMTGLGTDVVGNTPEAFAAFQKAEIAMWAKIIRQSGARVE